jgi:hypothetical protein
MLTKLHQNILLYLCDFLDAASILNLSLTCKKSHQLINENETYWRLRYYKEFALDDDWREDDWLAWYCSRTAPKQPMPASQPSKTLRQKATRNWSHVHWRKAYCRRYMLNMHLINGHWRERCCDLQIDAKPDSLYIMDMNACAALIGENCGRCRWVVRHDIATPGCWSGELYWSELPMPRGFSFTEIVSPTLTNNFVFTPCKLYEPVTIDKSGGDDQSSSTWYLVRNASIVWDIRDASKEFPFYVWYDEVTDTRYLLRVVCSCDDWVLCYRPPVSDSQSNVTGHRYFICDLKRKSYYHFGPNYTISRAYFQAATDDFAQVIILYYNPDDIIFKHEASAMTDDKPVGLRVHWHSYVFDNEHNTSLEEYSGEIIMPYCDCATLRGKRYGPGLMLVTMFNAKDPEVLIGGPDQRVTLALVRVPDYSLPQTSISRYRRSRCGGAVGEVIWIQSVATHLELPLYSQNLIVTQQGDNINILSGTDGKIVHRFNPIIYERFSPIIGSYCYLVDRDHNHFVINMETGEAFQHRDKLLPSKKHRSAAPIVAVRTADNDDTAEDANAEEDADFSMIENDNLAEDSSSDQNIESPLCIRYSTCCNCIGKLVVYDSKPRYLYYMYSLSGL